MSAPEVVAIDVFCGAGGLTYGLQKAKVKVVAGIDLDPACEFPFESNNAAEFLEADVRKLTGKQLKKLYPKNSVRVLAGCAPCQPFSPFRRSAKRKKHGDWKLLEEFQRLIEESSPELVTMENVPDLASKPVFRRFVNSLKSWGYKVDYRSVYCPRIGIPQHRRRLVLMASRIGDIKVPADQVEPNDFLTVRETIEHLPEIVAGQTDHRDRLHKARSVSAKNLRRLQASKPGGTWRDWPKALRSKCHRKKKGASYQCVYSRMSWDEPSPTITTQAYSFGTGRFGHPEQDRSITLREAALLQTFPRSYSFVKPGAPVYLATVGRLIGNAVPPQLGFLIGKELRRVAAAAKDRDSALRSSVCGKRPVK